MSEPLGLIVGESVMNLVFRVPRNREVYVGDILVAVSPSEARRGGPVPEGHGGSGGGSGSDGLGPGAGARHFLRVVDVKHGADAAGPDWLPRVAGNMLVQHRELGEAGAYADGDDRLYKMGVAVPLGTVRDGTFRKSKTLPPHFAPVRRAGPDDYAFLTEHMGDLEIGHLRSGEETVPFAVGIDGSRSFPYHVGIFATTGMGKSNLMKVLAGSCLGTGRYGLLIVDPHGEYYEGSPGCRGLSHHPRAPKRLVVYAARKLRGPHHKLQISTHEVEVADLRQLFEFTEAQSDFLNGARRRYGGAWLAEIHDKQTAVLVQEVQGTRFDGPVEVVKRKIARLFDTGLLHRDERVTCTGPVLRELREGKVVLVDTGGLTDAEELLVATVLARALLESGKRAYEAEGFDTLPPVMITLEEAQRVLGKGSSKGNVFGQIAREGRKFKVGICAITQQPKLLDTEVVSQLNTLFILGLADKRDRDILQDSAKQDVGQLENEIQMLMPGECLLTSPYAPFAVPAKVHLYEEWLARLPAAREEAKVTVDRAFY